MFGRWAPLMEWLGIILIWSALPLVYLRPGGVETGPGAAVRRTGIPALAECHAETADGGAEDPMTGWDRAAVAARFFLPAPRGRAPLILAYRRSSA